MKRFVPDPHHNTAARSTPPGELLWTREQALDFAVHRDAARVRLTPPPLSQWDPSPEDRKAMEYLWRAFETGGARVFEPRDIYGIERLCPVPRSRWRVDPTAWVVEKFEAMHGNFAPFISRFERCTAGVLISAAELMAALSEPAPAPEVAEADAAPSATESGRRGGKKSGEVRRESRPWVPHAEELALAVDPNLSNEGIATEISGGWKRADVDPPGSRTLAGFVAQLRTGGKLPQRKPRSRS